jgi:hypothetical protein
MLIPFGILSAAGAGVGVAGDYELIETTFGTGSSAAVLFSSIPQTYKHLQVRVLGRGTNTGQASISVRFNNISTASYAWHILYGDGSSVISTSSTGNTRMFIGSSTGSNYAAGSHAATIFDVLDYTNTSKNTTVRDLSGRVGTSDQIQISSNLFNNTAAITSIELSCDNGNWTNTSRFSLYGIRG